MTRGQVRQKQHFTICKNRNSDFRLLTPQILIVRVGYLCSLYGKATSAKHPYGIKAWKDST